MVVATSLGDPPDLTTSHSFFTLKISLASSPLKQTFETQKVDRSISSTGRKVQFMTKQGVQQNLLSFPLTEICTEGFSQRRIGFCFGKSVIQLFNSDWLECFEQR